MAIYDREYYREDSAARSRGLIRGHSAVTVLIALNVLIFLLWQIKGFEDQFMTTNFLVERDSVLHYYHIHTLITSAFSHIGIWHIVMNMLFLYWFGQDLEAIYGSRDFVILYLFGAIVASLVHIGISTGPALGASGSVMAIVVACALFYPDKEMNLLIFFILPIRIKLKWLALFFIAMDLLGVAQSGHGDGIAHGAHLGGAAAGFLYWKLDMRLFTSNQSFFAGLFSLPRNLLRILFPDRDLARLTWRGRWKRVFFRPPPLRIVSSKSSSQRMEQPEPPKKEAVIDSSTAQRVDSLLEKISHDGIGALTDEERTFLEASSKKYRK